MRHAVRMMAFFFLLSCSSKTADKKIGHPDTLDNKITGKEISGACGAGSGKILRLKKRYKFEDYKVPIFEGTLAEPDFSGNPYADDKEYVDFIKTGCRENKINFAGHYTIIGRGCGLMCEHVFIVDRKNGHIFTDTKPSEGRYGYEYRKDSELLIANSNLFVDDKFETYTDNWCQPEFYKWNKEDFTFIQ